MKLGHVLLLLKFAATESGLSEDIIIKKEGITLVETSEIQSADGIIEASSSEVVNLDLGGVEAEVYFTEIIVERAETTALRHPHQDSGKAARNSKKHSSSSSDAPEVTESHQKTQNRIHKVRERLLAGSENLLQDVGRQLREESIEEKEDTMLVAIAAGIGGFFVMMVVLVTACCISRKRRLHETVTTLPKRRTVEANPVEQTFERLDFTRTTIGTSKRIQKAKELNEITTSEIAPSSMGTLRTFVDRSHQKPVGGNESDFRNTSSDIDSIESSNPPKSSKIITVITEKTKYGYQELATRDRSNYSSSTSSSCDKNHHVIVEEAKPPPAYDTITRSRDSVIDL